MQKSSHELSHETAQSAVSEMTEREFGKERKAETVIRKMRNLALLKLARKEGAKISLGTDAHHFWQLSFIELGLAAALKAKIPPERIINFMPLKELKKWVKNVRALRPNFC